MEHETTGSGAADRDPQSSGKPALALIVAVAENGVIGNQGDLPWRQSSDLKRFRGLTLGKPLIMGRKTFAAIGKPLDGRDNIVITRDAGFSCPGVTVASEPAEAMQLARSAALRRGASEVMVIGGAEIYRLFLADADRIYLTRVHCTPPGDVHFPDLDPAEWREIHRETLPKGPRDDWPATLVVLDRTPDRPTTNARSAPV